MLAWVVVTSADVLPCVEDSIASMLCSPSGPAPSVALCIAGAARTFENKIVHRSLKENVIERLGAPVTTFAFLKLGDARGDSRVGYGATIQATEEGVRRACRVLGVSQLQIKRDSYNAPPDCPNYAVYPTFDECPTCHVNGSAHQQSLLGQLENRATCFKMISEHERSRGRTFDWVLLARPDLTWVDAVVPWCRHVLPKRVGDWTFWLPREGAEEQLLAPWIDHYACKTPPMSSKTVEAHVRKHTRLLRSRDSPATLPAILTRVHKQGFPLNIDEGCRMHMALSGADPPSGFNSSDAVVHNGVTFSGFEGRHCIPATSSSVCNSRRSTSH